MPVTLAQIVDRVEAAKPSSLERTVREVIAAMGHEVGRDGQVYNPAEGAYRSPAPRIVPRDQRFATRHRRG